MGNPLDAALSWQRQAACRRLPHPEMPFVEPCWPAVLHQCLSHCSVLEQCRAWAAGQDWSACVVGGLVWAHDKERGGSRPSRMQPAATSRHCPVCRPAGPPDG